MWKTVQYSLPQLMTKMDTYCLLVLSIEIICFQCFHNLTPVDPKLPLISTKDKRVLLLNVIHLHTKHENCPSLSFEISCLQPMCHTYTRSSHSSKHKNWVNVPKGEGCKNVWKYEMKTNVRANLHWLRENILHVLSLYMLIRVNLNQILETLKCLSPYDSSKHCKWYGS